MPINAGYEYMNAEKKYLEAKTLEEKIACLEEMIRVSPKHKSSENFVANLKQRLNKLMEKQEKASKKSGGRKGVKKEGFQVVLLGFSNSGKSSLLSKLTNAKPLISSNSFTTKHPEIGTMFYQGVKAQIVDLPSIGSEYFDIGIINTADLILIVSDNLEDLDKINSMLSRAYGKKLIAVNKSDLLSHEELRKLEAKIRSKKLDAVIISCESGYNLEYLKQAIFNSMSVIRVYTKEPGKIYTSIPVVLPKESSVKDAAESIRKGFSNLVKETRLTGPSSKFPNQKVGLSHKLKDKDIVEFHT